MTLNKAQSSYMGMLLRVAIEAASEAGKAILDVYNSDFTVVHKEDKSPLTMADRRSHDVIVEQLSAIGGAPIPILSEEGKDVSYETRRNWSLYWLVDPLDGTKEFVKRNGEFTVNIALIRAARPVLGVIYVPVTDVMYYASEDGGAYRETGGEKKKLPLDINRTHFTIVGSRSHATPEQGSFIEELKRKKGKVDFISAGSSLKFCLVAEGKADVYPRFGPTMEWDTAAGQAIVEQAGGQVIHMQTKERLMLNKENLMNPWFEASLMYKES